jgi:hypothetical protein
MSRCSQAEDSSTKGKTFLSATRLGCIYRKISLLSAMKINRKRKGANKCKGRKRKIKGKWKVKW